MNRKLYFSGQSSAQVVSRNKFSEKRFVAAILKISSKPEVMAKLS